MSKQVIGGTAALGLPTVTNAQSRHSQLQESRDLALAVQGMAYIRLI